MVYFRKGLSQLRRNYAKYCFDYTDFYNISHKLLFMRQPFSMLPEMEETGNGNLCMACGQWLYPFGEIYGDFCVPCAGGGAQGLQAGNKDEYAASAGTCSDGKPGLCGYSGQAAGICPVLG